MPIIDTEKTTKPIARQLPRTTKLDRPESPLPMWRPEPTGLTRAELRRIVLDAIG